MNDIEYLSSDETGAMFIDTSNNTIFIEYYNEDGTVSSTKKIDLSAAKRFVLNSNENMIHIENTTKYLNLYTASYYPEGLL